MNYETVWIRVFSWDLRLVSASFRGQAYRFESWRSFLWRHGVPVQDSSTTQVYIESDGNEPLSSCRRSLTAGLDDDVGILVQQLKHSVEYGIIVRSTDWLSYIHRNKNNAAGGHGQGGSGSGVGKPNGGPAAENSGNRANETARQSQKRPWSP